MTAGAFWIPRHRWQLLDFFKRQRPDWNVKSWPKKRLYAMYFKLRQEKEAIRHTSAEN